MKEGASGESGRGCGSQEMYCLVQNSLNKDNSDKYP